MALKSVLITGGTGFVGSATARALAEKHPECAITIIDIKPPNATHVLPSNISFIQADVTSPEEIKEAVKKVSPVVLIHTAGIVPPLSERYGRKLQSLVWKINVDGTRNVLEAAKQAGVQAFIYTSSCCAVTDDMRIPYPNIDERWPTSRSSLIYGESKVIPPPIGIMAFFQCANNGMSGCCRGHGSRGIKHHPGDLRSQALGALWPGRLPIGPVYPRMYCQGRDPLYNW